VCRPDHPRGHPTGNHRWPQPRESASAKTQQKAAALGKSKPAFARDRAAPPARSPGQQQGSPPPFFGSSPYHSQGQHRQTRANGGVAHTHPHWRGVGPLVRSTKGRMRRSQSRLATHTGTADSASRKTNSRQAPPEAPRHQPEDQPAGIIRNRRPLASASATQGDQPPTGWRDVHRGQIGGARPSSRPHG